MFRIFSTALLLLLSSSGCSTVRLPHAWGLAPGAMAASQDQHEIRVAIVPPEEREQREAESSDSFPETPAEVLEEFPDEVLPLPADSAPQIAAIDPQTPSTLVRVYYGTNRPLRNEPVGNRYGTCDVSIPARHQFGELERPSLWRLEFRESEARHVLLKSVTPLEGDACLVQMRTDLARTRSPDIFVFIHGYNVSFQEAAMRTAQMAFDLKFGGVPLFYSWPSRGDITGYGSDLRQADGSASHLAEFLTRVAQESGARQIHLVAHSMGNRALVGALTQISGAPRPSQFQEVIFAAPDLDAGQFATEIAPRIRPVVQRATIYSSGSDLALWASRLWNRTVRLGQPGRYLNQISEYDWIDVIDATSIGFDWFELGHSAYGGELLVDLHRVLAGRPVGSPSELNGSQTWTVARPSGSIPSPSAQPVYRIRTRWPLAPVDRWR